MSSSKFNGTSVLCYRDWPGLQDYYTTLV